MVGILSAPSGSLVSLTQVLAALILNLIMVAVWSLRAWGREHSNPSGITKEHL